MGKIEFVKYEALGNSYIVIDPDRASLTDRISLTEVDAKWIARLCDKSWGIGSDGVLWGPLPLTRRGQGANAGPKVGPQVPGLRIFNSDGSEGEKSGNGLRIFAQYLRDTQRIQDTFEIETIAGIVSGQFLKSGLIEIDMGLARLVGNELQETLEVGGHGFDVTRVNVGNPHCVVFGGFSKNSDIRSWGSAIENHVWFPERTNTQFVEVIGRDCIQIEIWERGSSYTLASGSSSCAAAYAAYRRGLVDAKLRVKMPGGELGIEILGGDNLRMTGPVTWIASGHCVAPL